jgi:hypothetical protein
VIDGLIEAGNKALINTGTVKFYGMDRNKGMSRLTEVVKKDTNIAYVEEDLDWKEGDELYFAPTAM